MGRLEMLNLLDDLDCLELCAVSFAMSNRTSVDRQILSCCYPPHTVMLAVPPVSQRSHAAQAVVRPYPERSITLDGQSFEA